MKGATEYARFFGTGQYGRLYIVSGYHARGKTFHIFILPENENALPNGPNNPPLNTDAVEVYGVLGGYCGWTEYYGWLRKGKWVDDFEQMVVQRKKEIKAEMSANNAANMEKVAKEDKRVAKLLAKY